jgi:hypothetical protein
MHACHRITGRGLVSVYSASLQRGAALALGMDRCTSGTRTTASYVQQGVVCMPRRKPGAPDQYRLRRVRVEFDVEENTASPDDEDSIILAFKQSMPEFKVVQVEFPYGTYWDELPDPTVIPDKD